MSNKVKVDFNININEISWGHQKLSPTPTDPPLLGNDDQEENEFNLVVEDDISLTNSLRKSKKTLDKNYDGIKRIILVTDNQLPLVKFYLDSIKMDSPFIYYEENGYKRIESLRPNLLLDNYWVISNIGKKGSINPPALKYNDEVIKHYLNHIIICQNWSILKELNKENYTIPLEFNKESYPYETVFVSSMGDDILKQYIQSRLGNVLDVTTFSQVVDYVLKPYNKKNIVNIVSKFENMVGYSFEDVIKQLEKESYKKVNQLIECLVLKKKKVAFKAGKYMKYAVWGNLLKELIMLRSQAYVITVLKNSIENIEKLKNKKSINAPNEDFLNSLIKDVDSFNILLLKSILNKKSFEEVLLGLDNYMNLDSRQYFKRWC